MGLRPEDTRRDLPILVTVQAALGANPLNKSMGARKNKDKH